MKSIITLATTANPGESKTCQSTMPSNALIWQITSKRVYFTYDFLNRPTITTNNVASVAEAVNIEVITSPADSSATVAMPVSSVQVTHDTRFGLVEPFKISIIYGTTAKTVMRVANIKNISLIVLFYQNRSLKQIIYTDCYNSYGCADDGADYDFCRSMAFGDAWQANIKLLFFDQRS